MTKEEIVTALLDDVEMPYLQDWQARDIVDFVLKKYTEGLPTLKGWVAREPKFNLMLFTAKPERFGDMWDVMAGEEMPINPSLFPDLRWEDDPIEVELLIKKV